MMLPALVCLFIGEEGLGLLFGMAFFYCVRNVFVPIAHIIADSFALLAFTDL